jgi:large subunit ribosomal protein L10
MPLSKKQKEKSLKDLKEKVVKQKAIFFVDFTGFKVKDMSSLRKKMREIDGEFKAAKKTLIGLALKDAKIEVDARKLTGEVALILGYKDEISPAKLIWETANTNKNLKILGGFMNNKLITKEDVENLAQLPSRDQLLAKLVGSIASPMSGFMNVLQGNTRGLVQVLSQISKQKVN